VDKANKKNKMLPSTNEPAPVITKTSNRFEVLCNLNEDATRGKPKGKSPIQFCTNNSNKKIGGQL
jgi:hypothetical protein